MDIQPKNLTLDMLLERKLFEIPDYQRAYSWKQKHINDLFEDIKVLEAKENEKKHFMASIVCLKKGKPEILETVEYEKFDIVDGQQRITTLIILLKAISLKCQSGEATITDQEKKVGEELGKIIIKDDEKHVLLQTNHDSSLIFSRYLKTGIKPKIEEITNQHDDNLLKAFEECEKFVEDWHSSGKLIDLIKIVRNRLYFIFFEIPDESAVYTVFEVLNSRGLQVDWLDKCKSALMGIAYERINDEEQKRKTIGVLHDDWRNIYGIIGLTDDFNGDDLIQIASTLHVSSESKIKTAEDSLDYFKGECKGRPEKIKDVSKWILEVAIQLQSLYKNKKKSVLLKMGQARLLALALNMNKKIPSKVLEGLMRQWEIVTFRIFGLGDADARKKMKNYVNLAKQVFNNALSYKEIFEKLKELSIAEDDYGTNDFSIDEVVKKLKDIDCYSQWSEELRYFLYRYEISLGKEYDTKKYWEHLWEDPAKATIEHIMPQTRTKQWAGKTHGKHLEKETHRLGNLLLLPKEFNSEASNYSFREKKKVYKKVGFLMFNDVNKKNDWNPKAIEKRENDLINWAKTEFADLAKL